MSFLNSLRRNIPFRQYVRNSNKLSSHFLSSVSISRRTLVGVVETSPSSDFNSVPQRKSTSSSDRFRSLRAAPRSYFHTMTAAGTETGSPVHKKQKTTESAPVEQKAAPTSRLIHDSHLNCTFSFNDVHVSSFNSWSVFIRRDSNRFLDFRFLWFGVSFVEQRFKMFSMSF